MTSSIDFFNRAMAWVFDWIVRPFSALSPAWGLVLISIISGLILLWFYGKLSDQQGLRETKRKIGARMLEAVLYRQDIRVSLRAQGHMFYQAFVYLKHAVIPIIVLMIPVLIILAQLNERYGALPVAEGQELLVRARFDTGVDFSQVALAGSPGLELSAPVRMPSESEALWRIKLVQGGEQGGEQTISLKLNEETLADKAIVSDSQAAMVPVGTFRNWFWALLYPGERLLPPGQPLKELLVHYSEPRYRILGMRLHWLVVFLIFSILAGVVGSKFMGVEI